MKPSTGPPEGRKLQAWVLWGISAGSAECRCTLGGVPQCEARGLLVTAFVGNYEILTKTQETVLTTRYWLDL